MIKFSIVEEQQSLEKDAARWKEEIEEERSGREVYSIEYLNHREHD